MSDDVLGPDLGWQPAPLPDRVTLTGRTAVLAPVDSERDAEPLYAASHGDNIHVWDYLFAGPFADLPSFAAYLRAIKPSDDPLVFTVIDRASGEPVGMLSLMRIVPTHGVIEVGGIWFSPAVQRSRLTTEAIYLIARYAFDLGYRRLEWKCNALNEASRRAAIRLGFVPEGIFRQHMVVKGRSRDTAWFSITDTEWPLRRAVFERWLSDQNFDAEGQQRQTLAAIRTELDAHAAPPP